MFHHDSARPCNRRPLSLLIASDLMTSGTAFAQGNVEEIVVSAAGYQQQIIDAPASISVVTRDDLQRQEYSSIVDAMRDIPGVYVTGGGNMQDISVRGMSSSYTLYLVDGRPISAGRSVNTNGSDGGKQIGMPPLSMIERVEVIRGPMSSLYGSEAIGGVVNVITRAVPQEWGGNIGADYTLSRNDISNDEYNTDFYLGRTIANVVLRLQHTGGSRHTDEGDFKGGGDTEAQQPESVTRNLGAKLPRRAHDTKPLGLRNDPATPETTQTPGKSLAADAAASN